ncbi:MAG: DUF3501 family protein [Fimbriimonadaceae bacterium]|nr:DUF3501 family protein [Alphaproteobacteria bacterium]
MQTLTREDLFSLEQYSTMRPDYRAKVMEHKKNRKVAIGPNATLYFEDVLTVQYQIQEMLRIEKIFDADGIREELDTYNPMIPTGANWKATFMMEYTDVAERQKMLAKLIGIEKTIWIEVEGCEKVHPIANEDLDRETDDKTSSVHFLRFELTPEMVAAAKSGAAISSGIDHRNYIHENRPVPDNVRESLANDLSAG